MTPVPTLTPLLPDDETRRLRRDALVAEVRRSAGGRPTVAVRGVPSVPPARRMTRRRVVHGGLAVSVVAVAAVVGTTAIPGIGGSSVDVVASARAAVLPSSGEILHTVVQFQQSPSAGPKAVWSAKPGTADARLLGTPTGKVERWSTTDPLRERTAVFVSGDGRPTPVAMQIAYADGVQQSKSPGTDQVQTTRTAEGDRGASDENPTLASFGASHDPVAAIQALLASGKLHEDGRTERDGRSLVRLVGSDAGTPEDGSNIGAPGAYEYLVDAKTFAPVVVTATYVLPARPDAEEPAARQQRRVVSRWTFSTFERLPLNAATEPLLRIDD